MYQARRDQARKSNEREKKIERGLGLADCLVASSLTPFSRV